MQLKGCTQYTVGAVVGSVLSAVGRFKLDFLDFRERFTLGLT